MCTSPTKVWIGRGQATTIRLDVLSNEMKIEYIPDGSSDCPLIILYGYEPDVTSRLRGAVLALAEGKVKSVSIHEIDGFDPVDALRLTAIASKRSHGVLPGDADNDFRWELTPTWWSNVEGLLSPFCTTDEWRNGHQWLDETSNISVLVSAGRAW